eukprot:g3854.t1
MMDSSGDGSLSKSELLAAFRVLGIHTTKGDVGRIFAILDSDGDGSIQYRELFSAVHKTDNLREKAIAFRKQRVKEILPSKHTRASKLRQMKSMGQLPQKKDKWLPSGPVRRYLKSASIPNLLPPLPKSMQRDYTGTKSNKKSRKKRGRAKKVPKLSDEYLALRGIIIREDYLKRCRDLVAEMIDLVQCRKIGLHSPQKGNNRMILEPRSLKSLAMETAVLLIELRNLSSSVVESIMSWKRQSEKENGGEHVPFLWQNENYLLKMKYDTDFLYEMRTPLAQAIVRIENEAEGRKKYMEKMMNKFKGASAKDDNDNDAKPEKSINPLDFLPPAVIAKLTADIEYAMAEFKKADKSGDGLLDADEFDGLLKTLKLEITHDQKRGLYVALDRDGDGQLDCKELFNAIRDTDTAKMLDVLRFQALEEVLITEYYRVHATHLMMLDRQGEDKQALGASKNAEVEDDDFDDEYSDGEFDQEDDEEEKDGEVRKKDKEKKANSNVIENSPSTSSKVAALTSIEDIPPEILEQIPPVPSLTELSVLFNHAKAIKELGSKSKKTVGAPASHLKKRKKKKKQRQAYGAINYIAPSPNMMSSSTKLTKRNHRFPQPQQSVRRKTKQKKQKKKKGKNGGPGRTRTADLEHRFGAPQPSFIDEPLASSPTRRQNSNKKVAGGVHSGNELSQNKDDPSLILLTNSLVL